MREIRVLLINRKERNPRNTFIILDFGWIVGFWQAQVQIVVATDFKVQNEDVCIVSRRYSNGLYIDIEKDFQFHLMSPYSVCSISRYIQR